ncbi:TIGR04133 family radical SAM/SPASM protein [Porphyromonas levii]|uniref:TIGR04133 family radical SAM/SPASM protein n=1 Tax=Porphyromonas levii TaxID=28114 RepID=UPI001B8B9329|nr:TIGR04133 family radical SAM/SPASM protein [Porphyromonas levii]MBR8730161.1 PqqA peptide cyclase [Porphyromonas levii]MBR8759630.1 PqqA peptide cyclase [Porphyromonas levii]MBR8763563.1 PqqA peptide cyclase [Porphyromonas levii]MBR8785619.1 PqqA peptide cyclase [Porphyromonas levii]MBR8803618.1 PqqA peptide cyclase [Porphyromonas levii]
MSLLFRRNKPSLTPSLRQRLALEAHRILRDDNIRTHQMTTLFWECTLRCNLHCAHCGSDCRVQSGVEELSADQFIQIIDDLTPHVQPHQLLIIFTGGEALVRKDIEEVGLALYRRGYPWGIVTNGMLLDEKRLESLRQAGIHTATISLDGLEEAHNAMRGHPLSYARAWHAIQLLSQVDDILWDVVTCVNPMNFDSLPTLRQQLIDQGVKRWRLFSIFPVGRAAEHRELQLSDRQHYDLMNFICETNEEGKIQAQYGCEGYLGSFEGRVRQQFYHCRAGINVASILCDGSISACPSIRYDYKQGNIHHDDLWEVWENRFEKYRNRSWAKIGACAQCKDWKYCLGNGMHLHDDEGKLLVCHLERLKAGAHY